MHTPPLFLPDNLYNSMLNRHRRAWRLQLHAAEGKSKAVMVLARVRRIDTKVYNNFSVFILGFKHKFSRLKCSHGARSAVKYILTGGVCISQESWERFSNKAV